MAEPVAPADTGNQTGAAEAPMRGELLSVERLADRARELAAEHAPALTVSRRPSPLGRQLRRAADELQAFNSRMVRSVQAGRATSPAIEWLLDNYYLIDEQIRTATADLPRGYGAELPRLSAGAYRDHPRVYALAAELVRHTDARVESDQLERFLMAYQETQPLTIGEVWAVPIVLRVALVEDLRRLSARVGEDSAASFGADDWADRILTALGDRAAAVPGMLAEMGRDPRATALPFLVRLAQRMNDQEADVAPVTTWIERALARAGMGLHELIQAEHQRQAADQVSIANAITAIRFVDAFEWRAFFERCNLVETTLRTDPAGVYAAMDFESRDRYRHALEQLAKRCDSSEVEVARAVVDIAAQRMAADASDLVNGHVGYYLISGGRYELERRLRYRPAGREVLHRGPLAHRGGLYWAMLAAVTALLAAVLGAWATAAGAGPWRTALLMALALIPLSDLAVNVVNRTAAAIWPPRGLPKLDHERPVGDEHRTLVVVPALLTSAASLAEVVERMEIHHLSGADPDIHIALLADLRAAPERHLPGDAAILEAAEEAVDELNRRYGAPVPPGPHGPTGPFHLFVRARRLDEAEGVWMGWERKRGALSELVRFLRGATDTSITTVRGDAGFLSGVAFVLTLDADTVLPRDAARKLVCTIAHPLNRAQVDPDRRVVTRGYGLVQPRVGMTLTSASATHYAGLNTGPTGIDPYSGAVSDVYQDVFGEGSFTGKGIFEVDVFATVLEGRIPENRVLSHDLLEGCFLRTALASDIEVLDDYPDTYAAQCSRVHRWVRGDWQILPWLGAWAPGPGGTRYRNPLTGLHRFKIADNLRRSVFPASMVVLGAAGWSLVPDPGWAWPATLLFILLFQAMLHAVDSLLMYPRGVGFMGAVRPVLADLTTDLTRAGLTLSLLPHQALLQADAAVRALWRAGVSHRRLLEWTTAAEAQAASGRDLVSSVRSIGPSVLLALAAVTPAALTVPASRPFVSGAALVWLASPVLAWWVSTPIRRREGAPATEDAVLMRRIARKTWRFFETFVTADERWLAPDNYQEDPKGEIAHRTSPTNMGLQLLATLTARDLGFIELGGLVDRTSRTLETMVGLERFRGHFYNWYDTRTGTPLRPAYVSTVDSGNLVGHLLTLKAGLHEAENAPLVSAAVLPGIADGLRLALDDLLAGRAEFPTAEEADALRLDVDGLLRRVTLAETPRSLAGWSALLGDLDRVAEPVLARAGALASEDAGAAFDSLDDAVGAIRAHAGELASLAPWTRLIGDAPRALLDTPAATGLAPILERVPSLADLAGGLEEPVAALLAIAAQPPDIPGDGETAGAWALELATAIEAARPACAAMLARSRLVCSMIDDVVDHTDFAMLYDEGRDLFSIGFNTEQGRLDDSYYDMLASECRLASYVAIARGQVPQDHWFRLGRQLTRTAGGFALLSWSASMFEYLMPVLVMRSFPDTLLDATYRTVVRRQIQYGAERGVPWGVSESAFNAKDAELTYQYQAFGVPGLGLKRGLSDDVVVAPYATLLALPVDRTAALANLRAFTEQGAEGRYGFYESIDYTPGRVPAGKRRALVKAYMAHHQGMGLVALGNELTGGRMHDRFLADPAMSSTDLLLQERPPRHVKLAQPHVEEVEFVRAMRETPPPVARSYPLASTPTPATHFLSNGRYSVMITNAGGGYSRHEDLAVSRYREDITRDCWGQFVYLRDRGSGAVWSAAHQPTLKPADDYHCILSADRAEFRRRDGDIETYTEIVVSPEDDVEVRRVAVTNHGDRALALDLTSYFEVSMAPQASDQAHRTFSNLFVETEVSEQLRTVLFSRRPRSSDEHRVWGFHTLAVEGAAEPDWSCETDRARFLGRLRQPRDAAAAFSAEPLSGTVGAVLDPVCALRATVTIEPGRTERVAYTTGVAPTRYDALLLAEKYGDIRSAQRAIDLAWGTSQIELRDLGLTPDEAVVFQRLASRLLLTDPYSRLKTKTRVEATAPITTLWGLGISGDLPILLVKIERIEDAPLVRQALIAHQYWRHKGFRCDVVVLNTKPSAYHSELDDRLHMLVRTGHALQMLDKPGGVFIRRADQIAPDALNLLESIARATLEADRGPILLQLNRQGPRPDPPDPFVPRREPVDEGGEVAFQRTELAFDNGLGGFDLERGEYVIVLEDGATTPAPWVNVMASPEFGAMVSEAGVGCTWALNSHENRLTTWNNDPVSDGSGELIYVRDEESGAVWSPTQLPVVDEAPYVVRHGKGYSVFEHSCHGVAHELTWLVDADDPVRVCRLRITNLGPAPRELSVTQFVEWVLGDSRSRANQRVVTRYDTESRMLTAHNHFNTDFPGRVAFLACDRRVESYTASRTDFLGRNGTPTAPAALGRKGLGGLTGRFHDNCGALMTRLELAPGETGEVRFLLGQADTLQAARELARRHRMPDAADHSLATLRDHWGAMLGSVQVKTPDAALDVMVNGQALYQALACRMWGRTALYQSSGAFGFRDQLQDVMALTIARPDLARAQIVESARHQFEAGDVQHWWQPHSGRGVRTRFTDDRAWLPYVTADYIAATGDAGVLDERATWVAGPELEPGHEDLYLVPQVTAHDATVYEHCCAALDVSLGTGPHGLPLMGGGDWNDGMNRVGIGGAGESVWLAWFLAATLRRFAPVCESRGEPERAARYRAHADAFAAAAEGAGWDGSWYRRAYFDDGTPLGTRDADECRIDAIAQAWATISGAGDPERARRALDAVEEKLVRWEDGLVLLLDPPFDRMANDPGYIKGYVPGVRENGGQYTHAAVWVALAYALTGDGDEAVGLLDIINPVNHALTPADVATYRVEPYVLAADVYSASRHVGRGGWTWYTGAASWFYNVVVRTVLGIRTEAEAGARHLVVDPCVPKAWRSFSATVRFGSTSYEVTVENPRGVNRGVDRIVCDGAACPDHRVAIADDGKAHMVTVTLLGG